VTDSHAAAQDGPQATVYRAQEQDKPWGREQIFAGADGKYVGKIIHVTAGHSLSLQYHERKDETQFMISGEAEIQYGPVGGELITRRFGPGDVIHLPPRTVHRVTAISNVVFAESSTADPGWREDVVRLEDSYGRSGTTAP
jgi:mannose-6-phosphate isomerase